MSDEAERLLDGAVSALQKGEAASCISLASQALHVLARGDRRVPEALSLRGTARMSTDPQSGFEDLKTAVQLDPQEPQFHTALGQAFMATGQTFEAERALNEAFRLSKGHPAVAGLLGRCLLTGGKAFDAVQMLGPIVQSGRANTSLIKLFSEALFNSGDMYSARDVLSQLYGEAGPQRPDEKLQLARIDMALRDYAGAERLLTDLLVDDPNSVPGLISAVRLMDWMDDKEGLSGFLKRLETLAGDHPDALSQIMDLADEVSASLLERAENLFLRGAENREDIATLGFSLALYHDRHKAYDRAFDFASKANQRLTLSGGYLPQTAENREAALKLMLLRLSSARLMYQKSQGVAPKPGDKRFIYLVGAPRTGSSLIQSVLAAPMGVASVGERSSLYPYLQDAADKAIGMPAFDRLVGELAAAEHAGLTRMGRSEGVIVDKTPHHLFVAGLLSRVNPNSSFVQVFRDAGDVALSMFLRPFSPFFAEATNLDALADMLNFRLEAYRVWNDAGLGIKPFSYEAFTSAPAEQGERLYSALGLTWDVSALDPAARPDAVPTFSSRQVRKPITAKSTPHWMAYRDFAPDAFDRLAEISAAQDVITATNL